MKRKEKQTNKHIAVVFGSVTQVPCIDVWVAIVTVPSFHAGVKLTKAGSDEASVYADIGEFGNSRI